MVRHLPEIYALETATLPAHEAADPGPLLSYTKKREIDAHGATLGALLTDLDSRFPGIRFRMIDEQERIRPHIRVFVNGSQASDLGQPQWPRPTPCRSSRR
ncbi:MAG: hypothetical protein U1F11_04700 [Steroidobacteraceae bacterium]